MQKAVQQITSVYLFWLSSYLHWLNIFTTPLVSKGLSCYITLRQTPHTLSSNTVFPLLQFVALSCPLCLPNSPSNLPSFPPYHHRSAVSKANTGNRPLLQSIRASQSFGVSLLHLSCLWHPPGNKANSKGIVLNSSSHFRVFHAGKPTVKLAASRLCWREKDPRLPGPESSPMMASWSW